MAQDIRKYIAKIMCIILDILTNSLFCVLTLFLLAWRPNFVEDVFAGFFLFITKILVVDMGLDITNKNL